MVEEDVDIFSDVDTSVNHFSYLLQPIKLLKQQGKGDLKWLPPKYPIWSGLEFSLYHVQTKF